jgi:hypothetical protein
MSVIEFPGRGPAVEGRSEDEIHAEAFRDLEGHIGDCVCMARIAAQQMAEVKCDDGELAFSVFHLTEMLLNLQKYYKAAWEGENVLAGRLIAHPATTSRSIKEAVGMLPTEKTDEPTLGDLLRASAPYVADQVASGEDVYDVLNSLAKAYEASHPRGQQ